MLYSSNYHTTDSHHNHVYRAATMMMLGVVDTELEGVDSSVKLLIANYYGYNSDIHVP